jgi:hypothetical protein
MWIGRSRALKSAVDMPEGMLYSYAECTGGLFVNNMADPDIFDYQFDADDLFRR